MMDDKETYEISHVAIPKTGGCWRSRRDGQGSRRQGWKKSLKKQHRRQTRKFQQKITEIHTREDT